MSAIDATGWSTGAPTIATGSAQVLRSLGLVLIDSATGQVALTEKGRRI